MSSSFSGKSMKHRRELFLNLRLQNLIIVEGEGAKLTGIETFKATVREVKAVGD